MKRRHLLIAAAALAALPLIGPAIAQTFNDFWRFVTNSAAATGPFSATDYFPMVRGAQTYRVAGNLLVPTSVRQANPAGGFHVQTQANGGNDSNDCLAATQGSGTRGPCRTLQRVVNLIYSSYDPGGADFFVHIGAGTFNNTAVAAGNLGGQYGTRSASIIFLGAGSGSTLIDISGGGCTPFGHAFTASGGASIGLGSLELSTTCAGGSDFFIQNGAFGFHYDTDVSYGQAPNGQHIHVEAAGAMFELAAAYDYHISGEAVEHWAVQGTAYLEIDPGAHTITVDGAYDFPGGFSLVQDNGTIAIGQTVAFSFSGVTGPRAVIQTGGSVNALGQNASTVLTFFPGDDLIEASGGAGIFGAGVRPAPTLGATTGLGTGGTATLTPGSTNVDGTITIASGSAATAATGTIVMSLTTTANNYEPHCRPTLGPGWPGTATVAVSAITNGSTTVNPAVTIAFDTNGAALSTGQNYLITYGCSQS